MFTQKIPTFIINYSYAYLGFSEHNVLIKAI